MSKKINHYHCCDEMHICLESELKPICFNKQIHYYYFKVGQLNEKFNIKNITNRFNTINIGFLILFCPFCGVKLETFDDLFYEDLKKEGYDYDEFAANLLELHYQKIKKGQISPDACMADEHQEFTKLIPEKFKSDAWWVRKPLFKTYSQKFQVVNFLNYQK